MSEVVAQFLKAVSSKTDWDDAREFAIECLMLEAGVLTSPGSPTLSNVSQPSTITLVSQGTDSKAGASYAPSAQERAWYYHGITSDGDQPDLLYRTSSKESPWVPPTGRHANVPAKSPRPAYGTQLSGIWGTVGHQVADLVHAAVKRSYSVDPARFFTVPDGGDDTEGTLGPFIIWVTVHPDLNISVGTAHDVSQGILALLAKNGVDDAHVEWCEGVTFKLAGPPLLPAISRHEATAQARRHLTPLLGMPIAAAEMEERDGQGSVAFFFHENKDKRGTPSNKVLAVTNHHVVCEDATKRYDFRANSTPRLQIRVCGSRRFQRGLDDMRREVINRASEAVACSDEIEQLVAEGDEADAEVIAEARRRLEHHLAVIGQLESFYKEVNTSWADMSRRNVGVLEYSPPISVNENAGRYTEDWATIRLDKAKFAPNFKGNLLDLGNKFTAGDLNRMLNLRNDSGPTFKYPPGGRLRISGFVAKDELANPSCLDGEGQPCIAVLKDGCATDLTVGRCAGLESFLCGSDSVRSVEVAIYNYDKQSNPFSAKGDSGSLSCDGSGKMVALNHSGKARTTGSAATFTTYGTPAWRLREWIKIEYPNADYAHEDW